MLLAQRIQNITPSVTFAFQSRVNQIQKSGREVINFSIGEPDFDTPELIKEEAQKALQEGFTKYTPAGGINELREAVSWKLKKENSLSYPPEQIVISSGAKYTLYTLFQVLIDKGDEVIIPAPFWVSYPEMVKLAGGKPVIVNNKLAQDFKITSQILEEALTERTRALILNSPNNPTGAVYDETELEVIGDWAVKHRVYIISDEIYEKFVYPPNKHTSIGSLRLPLQELVIIVNGFSKTFGMTGWRIGYAAGPKEIIQAMIKLQSQSISCPNSIAQKASVKALRESEKLTAQIPVEFKQRRDKIIQKLNEIKGIKCNPPQGAFYVFPDVSYYFGGEVGNKVINNSLDLCHFLLEETAIACVPGSAFGLNTHIRLSYALSLEKIDEGMERLKIALHQIKIREG
jgi:aspartate aminotransferase